MGMISAAGMERGAVIAIMLMLSCYQDVVLATSGSGGSGDEFSTTGTPSSAFDATTTSSPTQISTSFHSTPMSATTTTWISPTTTIAVTRSTAITSLTALPSETLMVTGPPMDQSDGEDPPFWVYVGIAVGAGFVCGIGLLLFFTVCACKRTRRKGKRTEDEDSFIESQIQRNESLKSNLESKVRDIPHSSTTETFGITSPIILTNGDPAEAMEYKDTNAFGSKDPVWSSTPPQAQETALLRAGFQREGHMALLKPAQSLTTLHQPESAGRKIKLHSPQPERRQGTLLGTNPPRKAVSTSGLNQGDRQSTDGRRHYALQTATRDSTYDVPRDAYQSHTRAQAVPSHYDVPKHALSVHRESLSAQGGHPKRKPPQQNSQTHEDYYDTPKQALATVVELRGGNPSTMSHSKGGDKHHEPLYDVPRRATTLPHRQPGTGIYDTPKQLLSQGKRLWKTGAPPSGSRSDAAPSSSRTNKYSSPRHSWSLYNIPAGVGVEGFIDVDHVYDEPPKELVQRMVSDKPKEAIAHKGTSKQSLLPKGNLSWRRRSSSQYDLPSAEEGAVPGGDGRDQILSNRPNHKGSSSHKFFYV